MSDYEDGEPRRGIIGSDMGVFHITGGASIDLF